MAVKDSVGWPIDANNRIVWSGGLATVVGTLPANVHPISAQGEIVFVGSSKPVVGYISSIPVDGVTGNVATDGLGFAATNIKFSEAWPVDVTGKLAIGGVSVAGNMPEGFYPVSSTGDLLLSSGSQNYGGTSVAIPVDSVTGAVVLDTANPVQFRVASSGLRIPTAVQSFGTTGPYMLSRLRIQTHADLTGIVKFILPTFYTDKPSGQIMREIDLKDDFKFQVGIELGYRLQSTGHNTVTKLLSPIYDYLSTDKSGYIIAEVDIGSNVITKGSFFGLWTIAENQNLVSPFIMPTGNYARSEVWDNFETATYRSVASGSYFLNGGINGFATIAASRAVSGCYAPCAVLTEHNEPAWVVFGSSSPEGAYDNSNRGAEVGDLRGDLNGNRGWADKLFGTVRQEANVNLSKGADSLAFINATDTYVTPNRPTFLYRKQIAALCNPTKIAATVGSNDLTAIVTNAQFKALTNTHLANVRDAIPSVPVYGATYTPQAPSTDQYLTLVNQTPDTNTVGNSSTRGYANKDLRDHSGELLYDGVIDLAAVVENDPVAQDGKWKVDGVTINYNTIDGTHPIHDASTEMAEQTTVVTF